MKQQEWMRSVFMSFGLKLNPMGDSDVRADFLRRVVIEGECWVAARDKARVAGRSLPVQKAAYALFVGPLPQAARVIASWGNPRCCVADHLKLAV